MDIFQILTLSTTFIIALGGWVYASWQNRENQRIRRLDNEREIRQRKIERVLAYLDEIANLTSLYRILANESRRLVTDVDGRPVHDASGVVQIETKSIFPDDRLEEALLELKGKDTRNCIKLQVLSIHLRQGEIGDLLVDLDPTKEAQKELGALYMAAIFRLDKASNSDDISYFVEILEEVASRRLSLRKRVQELVDKPKMKQV